MTGTIPYPSNPALIPVSVDMCQVIEVQSRALGKGEAEGGRDHSECLLCTVLGLTNPNMGRDAET